MCGICNCGWRSSINQRVQYAVQLGLEGLADLIVGSLAEIFHLSHSYFHLTAITPVFVCDDMMFWRFICDGLIIAESHAIALRSCVPVKPAEFFCEISSPVEVGQRAAYAATTEESKSTTNTPPLDNARTYRSSAKNNTSPWKLAP